MIKVAKAIAVVALAAVLYDACIAFALLVVAAGLYWLSPTVHDDVAPVPRASKVAARSPSVPSTPVPSAVAEVAAEAEKEASGAEIAKPDLAAHVESAAPETPSTVPAVSVTDPERRPVPPVPADESHRPAPPVPATAEEKLEAAHRAAPAVPCSCDPLSEPSKEEQPTQLMPVPGQSPMPMSPRDEEALKEQQEEKEKQKQDNKEVSPAPPASPAPPTPSKMPPYTGTMRVASSATSSNCWSEPEVTSFVVRGKKYLEDHKKFPSRPSLCKLLAADVVVSPQRLTHFAAHPQCEGMKRLPGYIFVMNFILPGPPYMHFVLYFSVPDSETPETAVGLRLLKRFLSEKSDDEFRNSRFKIIPNVADGPWLVKRSVGNTPAILPKKLTTTYHRGERHFELDTDVGSSYAANTIFGVVRGSLKALVLDMAFVIEGHSEAELPEHILGAIRVNHADIESNEHIKRLY